MESRIRIAARGQAMKPRPRTGRATRLALGVLLCAALAAPACAETLLKFSWEWEAKTLQGTHVDGDAATFIGAAPLLREAVSDSLTSPGAGQTNVSVLAFGTVDLSTRGFGALAHVRSHVNPWPLNSSPQPLDTSVIAEVQFADRLFPFIPLLPIGTPMFFNFAPGVLTGSLQTPSELGAVGNAGVSLTFEATPVLGFLPTVERTFEESLTAGIHLGNPVVPANLLRGLLLANGVFYDWKLTLRVVAGVIPAVFDNDAPPVAEARSSFGNTYYWGGLESVFDSSGQLLSGVTLTSDSGFDLVTVGSVPEPRTWLLGLCGLAVLAWRLQRHGTLGQQRS